MISKLLKIVNATDSGIKVLILFAIFFILGLLSLTSSILIGNVTESLLTLSYNDAVIQLVIFGFVSLSLVVISYLSKVYAAKIKTSITKNLKSTTIKHLFQANTIDRQQFNQGDLIGRFNSDISSMATATVMTSQLIKSMIILAMYAIAIGLFDLRLLFLFMIPFPIVLFMQILTANKSEGFITPWKESMSNTYNLSQDIINNQINIRSYTAQDRIKSWINEAITSNFKSSIKGIFKLYVLQIPTVIIAFSSLVLIGAIGLQWVQEGTLTIAKLVATISLVTTANDEFNNILNMVNNIPHLIVSANRIFPIWDLQEESFGGITEGISDAPLIEFDNVTFSYNPSEGPNVLNSISFKVEHGDRIGVIGKSGSGKSTLMKLILGQYEPTQGCIYFKGVKVQEWDRKALRSNIASVTQDPYILATSVRDNLLIIDDSINDDYLAGVLQSLNLSDRGDTESLLDVQCGERGQNLSGGQRQRIALARSILKKSDIILLDEATSALDTLSEEAIQSVLADDSLLTTQILIAHRVGTLNHCNKIIVLDNGSITESGTPQELLNSKGQYYEALINSQGAKS